MLTAPPAGPGEPTVGPPATVPEGASTPPPLNGAAAKGWQAGTLTYTTGGLLALFGWLLFGDFAWATRDRSVAPAAQWYLNSLGVSSLLFGLLLSSFPAVLGLILSPVISVRSDRHRGPLGRRIPFLLATTPFAAIGMIGLGFTPVLATWLHGMGAPGHSTGVWLASMQADFPPAGALLRLLQNRVLIALICFGLFWAIFEIATIAAQAVFGGLINDVVPRPLLGRFFALFRAISLVDGMIFNFWIIGHVPTHFTLILGCVGAFYGVAFLCVCLQVKEGKYPPLPPRDSAAAAAPLRSAFGGVAAYFRESFSSPYYLGVFVMLATAALVFVPVNTFAIPYAKSLGIEMAVYGKFLSLTYLISLSLTFFLGWLADKFHPLRMAIICLIAYGLVAVGGAFLATTPGVFLTFWVLHGVLSGCYMTSAASLGQRLFPQSKFAQFASAAGIISALANMVLAPAIGLIIDSTGREFRYTFVAATGLALVALSAAAFVYIRFIKLGGPYGYQPPELA